MSDESTQKWLGRNRPPRVHITYDLETRGAIEKKELPLVVGILADLAGENDANLDPLRKRKFVEIDRDNFLDVMKSLKPALNIAVGDKPAEKVVFDTIDDFTPDRLVEKVAGLKEMLDVRNRLNDLLYRADGKEKLSDYLYAASQDEPTLGELTALLPSPEQKKDEKPDEKKDEKPDEKKDEKKTRSRT